MLQRVYCRLNVPLPLRLRTQAILRITFGNPAKKFAGKKYPLTLQITLDKKLFTVNIYLNSLIPWVVLGLNSSLIHPRYSPDSKKIYTVIKVTNPHPKQTNTSDGIINH